MKAAPLLDPVVSHKSCFRRHGRLHHLYVQAVSIASAGRLEKVVGTGSYRGGPLFLFHRYFSSYRRSFMAQSKGPSLGDGEDAQA